MVQDDLPLPQKLALGHSTRADRRIIEPFFLLDHRLAQFVSRSKEPVLTQMRIAWWRDQLQKPVAQRPEGDPVLDALSCHWTGQETALTALVDGWEGLLAEPPLPASAVQEFVEGRSRCFAAIAHLCAAGDYGAPAALIGKRWAYADLVSRISDEDEIAFVFDNIDVSITNTVKIPYRLRALSVLGALASKSLNRGGSELIESRRDLLTVMRVGLFG